MKRAAVFAVLIASCGGTWISPNDAYRIETERCATQPTEDDRRGCMNMVRNKYGRWLGEGGYPAPGWTTPGPTTGRIAGY